MVVQPLEPLKDSFKANLENYLQREANRVVVTPVTTQVPKPPSPYDAPEIRGGAPACFASDVFSIAALGWLMWTGDISNVQSNRQHQNLTAPGTHLGIDLAVNCRISCAAARE